MAYSAVAAPVSSVNFFMLSACLAGRARDAD
jgi:hypothetical protein